MTHSFPGVEVDGWRRMLNDYCQKNGLGHYLFWSNPIQTGPRNSPIWTIAVYRGFQFFNGPRRELTLNEPVNQVEYGRGSAHKLNDAKEAAAELALKALWNQRGV